MIASLFSKALGFSFVAIGAGAIAAPGFSSGQYGLATADATTLAYIRALGARDLVLGAIILALASGERREALPTVLAASALVGAADGTIVFLQRGTAAKQNLAIHAAGFVALIAAAALVRAER